MRLRLTLLPGLLLAATALLINNVVQGRLSQQRVIQRLDGDRSGPGKLSSNPPDIVNSTPSPVRVGE